MDAKERSLIKIIYGQIALREFDERDVLALLILLREHASKRSALRELADFVAHREKDRGSLQEYVQGVVRYGKAIEGNTSAQLRIDVVHTGDAFYQSLNEVFSRFDLPPVDRAIAEDVLMSVMSLLQEVRLIHAKQELGRLGLCRVGRDIWLAGCVVMGPMQAQVVFPALMVSNRYCAHADSGSSGSFSGLVEARCMGGWLRLYVDGQEAA